MSEANTTSRSSVHPLVRYLPLVAILVLMWPLGGQSLEVFGLELSAVVVGAVLAILGTLYGMLSARGR